MEKREIDIVRYERGELENVKDVVVIESPLEISINGNKKYFCMRLPGSDKELALGLLFNDNIINSMKDVSDIKNCDNEINVVLKNSDIIISSDHKIIKSSTGGIKSEHIIQSHDESVDVITGADKISPDKIFSMQDIFHNSQKIFNETGGTHSAALFDRNGELLVFYEDVGRHNALDKCIGKVIAMDIMKDAYAAVLSSRLSYEMVSKACRTGVQLVTGISAPTDLAVDLARKFNLTLAGFVRKGRFNVYSADERIIQ